MAGLRVIVVVRLGLGGWDAAEACMTLSMSCLPEVVSRARRRRHLNQRLDEMQVVLTGGSAHPDLAPAFDRRIRVERPLVELVCSRSDPSGWLHVAHRSLRPRRHHRHRRRRRHGDGVLRRARSRGRGTHVPRGRVPGQRHRIPGSRTEMVLLGLGGVGEYENVWPWPPCADRRALSSTTRTGSSMPFAFTGSRGR
ncbi:MAG: hypothetical protein QOJ68_1928 [Blastococcus sp.]|nr:hypothetical protein [Blastococcus sp.]